MSVIRRFAFRLGSFLNREQIEEVLSEELRLHVELQTEANIQAGMSPEEARRQALIDLGGVEQVKERYRDVRRLRWLEEAGSDLKYSVRQLRKSPGFTVVALATVALGIGINTTAFSVLNRLLFQSLPFYDTSRLVEIYSSSLGYGFNRVSPGDYFDLRDHTTVFEEVGAFNATPLWSYSEPGRPAVKCFCIVETANFLSLVGVQPQIGRRFTEEEQKHLDRLVLLSNAFWRNRYNSDPKAIGQTVLLNSKAYTIVGVLPVTMDSASVFGSKPDFFPLDGTEVNKDLRTKAWYRVAARLKPGSTIQQAQAELDVLAHRLAHDHPLTNSNTGFNVTPYPTTTVSDSEAHLVELVTTLSALILVIACVNLANLQFVRTTRRFPELAVRRALGCGGSRIVRMLLAECLLISVTGGVLGIFIAVWGNTVVARFLNYDFPLDGRVVAFSFAASAITGLLFGAGPAWVASKANAAAAMKAGAQHGTSDRSRRFLRQALVVIEISLAVTVLAGAGFFVAGIYRFMHRDLGWQSDHLVVGYLALSHDKYGEEQDPRSLLFTDRFREEMAAIPGVTAATVSRLTPVFGYNWEPFTVEGGPPPETGRVPYAEIDSTSPGFFETFGVKLLAGRDFNGTDRPGNPSVVIVNESLAKHFWPGENPIGKRIGSPDLRNPNWSEVIGVMQNFRTGTQNGPGADQFQYFRPWAQNTNRFFSFTVRTSGPPGPMKDAISKMVTRLDPDVAPYSLRTAEEALEGQVDMLVFVRKVLLLVSALGLLLAVVGLYGVVANLVAERTREIGVRIALGAQPRSLVRHFLKSGVVLTTVGLVIGVAASFELSQFLAKLLPSVQGDNPAIIAVVAGLLFVVAIFASWIPSWRASKVNPLQALRAE